MEQIDNTLVESASKGSWVAVAALVTWALVAAMKSDAIPIDIPPRARPIIALVLGQVFAVLSAGMGGVSWPAAIVSGLVATALAIAGQELGSSAKPASKLPPSAPPALGLLLVLGGVATGLSGCAGGLDPAKVAKALDGANAAVTIAEPCVTETLNRALDACETPECRDTQAAVNQAVVDGVAALRELLCFVKPDLEGC